MPAGLRELSGPLDWLIEFLGIDGDPVEVAAFVSTPLKEGPSRKELATWVGGLHANENGLNPAEVPNLVKAKFNVLKFVEEVFARLAAEEGSRKEVRKPSTTAGAA